MNYLNEPIRQVGLSSAEIQALQLPPLEFLLEPWLPVGTLSLLWAARETGKTHIAMNIAHAVATGGTFLKWKAPKARKVVYIDGEIGKRGLQTWLNEMHLAGCSTLKFVTLEDAPNGVIWNLTTPEGQAIYSELIKNADLVIIDNLAMVMRDGGRGLHSDVERWESVQTWAVRERLKGRAIIFLHHAGKSGEQRGSSTKEDVVDVSIGLRSDKDHDKENGIDCALIFEKARWLTGSDRETLRVQLHRDSTAWKWGSQKEHFKKRFIQMAKDGRSMIAIMAALNMTRDMYEIMKDRHAAEINGESAPTWTDTRNIRQPEDDSLF